MAAQPEIILSKMDVSLDNVKYEVSFRKWLPQDVPTIIKFIDELMMPIGFPHTPLTTEQLVKDGFGPQPFAFCFITESILDGKQSVIGYALCAYEYSSFVGKTIYMENLYFISKFRGLGIGFEMIRVIARHGIKNGCKRLTWLCSTDSEPALAFYRKFAEELPSWISFSLSGEHQMQLVLEK